MTHRVPSKSPAVLLLSPGIVRSTDLHFGIPHLVSLGGYVREQLRVRVELLDLGYEALTPAGLLGRLASLEPFLVIGISTYSSFDYRRVMALSSFLKRHYPGVPQVTGGYHPSSRPSDFLFEGSPFSAVIQGEGEVALTRLVSRLLGGQVPELEVVYGEPLPSLSSLPLTQWDLLEHYWPSALKLGGMLQLSLSRGCPYQCSFCMERVKRPKELTVEEESAPGLEAPSRKTSAMPAWRAYEPERALEELRRLRHFTALEAWIINLADPLFGLQSAWRRTVLEGIAREGLLPRQYWTLTRAEGLTREDLALLARSRVSIGIGLESGSPEMLLQMDKTRAPERYLEAIAALAERSRTVGLTWSVNVMVGHPGETARSIAETEGFVRRLFKGKETSGWLSVDPFRLYPGSPVYSRMSDLELQLGTRFYDSAWWYRYVDTAFGAEHVDPSLELDYEGRVALMTACFGPLVKDIASRFVGQGREIDQSFQKALTEQTRNLSSAAQEVLLQKARAARFEPKPGGGGESRAPTHVPKHLPLGLRVRDPLRRRLEEAVMRLLDRGVLHMPSVVDALLSVPLELFFGREEMEAVLFDRVLEEGTGSQPMLLSISWLALLLQGLQLKPGERVADLWAHRGYLSALLRTLVGKEGHVLALSPDGWLRRQRMEQSLEPWSVEVLAGEATTLHGLMGKVDALVLGGTLPALPAGAKDVLVEGGRLVLGVGPRFGRHRLERAVWRKGAFTRETLASGYLPVPVGAEGWTRAASKVS